MSNKPDSHSPGNFRIIPIWLLLLILNLWAIFISRPLWSDGALWFYEMFRTGDFYLELTTRYSVFLTQGPTIIFLKYFPEISIPSAKLLFSFSFGFVNFLWFSFGSIYLHHRKKNAYLLINFFLYLSIIMSAQGFYVGMVTETSSVGILLFWIFLIEEKSKYRNLISTFLLLVLLWGYELSFLFIPLYVFLLLRKKEYSFLFFLLMITTSILAYRIYLTTDHLYHDVENNFLVSAFRHFAGLNLLSALSIILFGLSYTNMKKTKIAALVALLLISSYVIFSYFGLCYRDIADHYFSARTNIIFKTGLVLTLVTWASIRNLSMDKIYLAKVICIITVVVLIHEVKLNIAWSNGRSAIRDYVTKGGCHFLDYTKDFMRPIEENGVPAYALPFMSIIERGKMNADAVMFSPNWEATKILNPCEQNDKTSFINNALQTMHIKQGPNIRFTDKIWERQE